MSTGRPLASSSQAAGNAPGMSVALHALATSLFLFLGFLAIVRGITVHGAASVSQLDDSIGELVARRAQSLADAEMNAEAYTLFQKALATPFEDPRQRVWAVQGFAEMLIDTSRPDEAIPRLETLVSENGADYKSWHLLVRAYSASGDSAKALRAAHDWLNAARLAADARAEVDAQQAQKRLLGE